MGMVAALALGWGIGQWFAPETETAERALQGEGDGPCAGGQQPLFWRNPMNPSITSPTFQKDSMGMDYIPVCPEDAAGGGVSPAGTVSIDPTIVQNIGVRTARAVQREVMREITTVGRVTFDETRLITLHPKVEGWVDRLFVDKTGEFVAKDTMLLALYSPQLVATQQEYLLALTNWDRLKNSPYPDIREGARRLLDASLTRLRFFDVPEHQIQQLQKTRKVSKNLHIHAPAAGVVTNIGVREGAHVMPTTELFRIADLSTVWVLADLYEYEIPWVHVGDQARLTVPSLPGREFNGRITYIYPYLDAKTRTNKVRIEFDNRDGSLKPDMFGDVRVLASARRQGVFIPREAVLQTGKRAHVFVRMADGKFEPRVVKTGVVVDGQVEVLQGVRAGELVVTSGQFLIDSESSIREAAAKMVAPRQAAAVPEDMDMSDMNMEDMEMPAAIQGGGQ